MPELFSTYYNSPVGTLKISASGGYICEVLFWKNDNRNLLEQSARREAPAVLQQCTNQLREYFNGTRHNFELPILQEGTEFQKRVWNELLQIPFGKTISYLELAKRLGDVKAIRAAGSTNGKNQVSIIVPCHRVIGSNQTLVGYGGGLPNKKWLLGHEARFAHGVQTLF
ncbi:MAG: methylated-DNA--[protein]-cysteine S-methyltransferase [Chitinophagaceae bacterium]